jgi:hypothetical protein
LVLNILLIVLSLFICTKCPAHASLLRLNTLTGQKVTGTKNLNAYCYIGQLKVCFAGTHK